ncbi:MAG: restriction endonuclease subunit S, partial [Alcaligenaceae bacterium]|nr:restriction endonuclease subunit S [Alcaligenaceae bacterium]
DDVIEKTRAQIDKLKDLKTGMMQELLTQGIGHTEFKDSPVGRIPASWGLVTLEQLIGKLEGGVSVNGENRPKGPDEIGVLKVSSVLRGKFLPNEYKTVLSTDVDRARINPTIDRILFSRANTRDLVGESAYVDKTYEDLFLPDKIWMLDVRDRLQVNVRWLSYILCSGNIRRAISDAATGTSGSMKNISKSSLLAITVPLPTLDEQKNIAKTLEAVDNELTGSTARLHTYENLKKALMQDLLTGKVRVKLDSPEVAAA